MTEKSDFLNELEMFINNYEEGLPLNFKKTKQEEDLLLTKSNSPNFSNSLRSSDMLTFRS